MMLSLASCPPPHVPQHYYLPYKFCNDLNFYKKNELESTFIKIVNPKKSNIFVGVIYRHSYMDLDFNVNLLNYNEHNATNEVLDSLSSNSFIPLLLQPIRITHLCITYLCLTHLVLTHLYL